MTCSSLPHIAIFPFMSKGHTIPLLHLARLLGERRLVSQVTIFTTPHNASFLRTILTSCTADEINIIPLDFPDDLPQSLDKVTSLTSFVSFVRSLELLQPKFEETMKLLSPPVAFLISDPFLVWPNKSAKQLAIPNISFDGMGCFTNTIKNLLQKHKPHAHLTRDDLRPFAIPGFPNIELTMAELTEPNDAPNERGPVHEYDAQIVKAMSESDGQLFNSFYELEAPYRDYWEAFIGPKPWCVGPLCLAVSDTYPMDELKIGIRIRARDGTRDGLVEREDLEVAIEELMSSNGKGQELRQNVENLATQARHAMLEEGGSSWKTLKQMIHEFNGKKD
ncbi:Glycosyltransferase [Rhynchospora pubera]|uniref:Glycosyltransferase n=1 Tax=Rhynchospora pubera TaxID=906938 RepID=A0AAV8EN78_9POAL|nr:Glycosyltransferase [Rhynchospora pubera]